MRKLFILTLKLLFQRFATVANIMDLDLFDANGLLREVHKSNLADYIWNLGNCHPDNIPTSIHYVLDCGALLHRIPWLKGEKCGDICRIYIVYVSNRYPGAVIDFDSYSDNPSTKDIAHMKRSKGITATEVVFFEDMSCRSNKDVFLTNHKNKQRFISLLGGKPENGIVKVLNTENDADVLIVKTRIKLGKEQKVLFVAEDADILVRLCYLVDMMSHDILLGTEPKRVQKAKLWDIKRTKMLLGKELCQLLPAILSLTVCDTTSKPFGIGKAAALKNEKYRLHSRDLKHLSRHICIY